MGKLDKPVHSHLTRQYATVISLNEALLVMLISFPSFVEFTDAASAGGGDMSIHLPPRQGAHITAMIEWL